MRAHKFACPKVKILGLMLIAVLSISGCFGPTNELPTASISASPTTGEAPLTVSLTANASDPDGIIVDYRWELGDGSTDSGQSITHTYEDAGSYRVTLTVEDDMGATAQAQQTIQVEAPPEPQTVEIVEWEYETGVLLDQLKGRFVNHGPDASYIEIRVKLTKPDDKNHVYQTGWTNFTGVGADESRPFTIYLEGERPPGEYAMWYVWSYEAGGAVF